MPTLPDLFEQLGTHGEHAGADAVFARAAAAARVGHPPVATVEAAHPRRHRRKYTPLLTAAVLTVVLIAVPVALLSSRNPTRATRPSLGPPFPPPASATAPQLATMHWSQIAPAPFPLTTGQVVAWAGDEVVVFGQDTLHDNVHGVGAAYSPTTNQWRTLPQAPLGGEWFFPISWA